MSLAYDWGPLTDLKTSKPWMLSPLSLPTHLVCFSSEPDRDWCCWRHRQTLAASPVPPRSSDAAAAVPASSAACPFLKMGSATHLPSLAWSLGLGLGLGLQWGSLLLAKAHYYNPLTASRLCKVCYEDHCCWQKLIIITLWQHQGFVRSAMRIIAAGKSSLVIIFITLWVWHWQHQGFARSAMRITIVRIAH